LESKRSENLTKNESDTISEFLPPPHPKIVFNHISQEISERAKAILDDLFTKKQITPDKVNPADRHMGFPTQTPGSIRRILNDPWYFHLDIHTYTADCSLHGYSLYFGGIYYSYRGLLVIPGVSFCLWPLVRY